MEDHDLVPTTPRATWWGVAGAFLLYAILAFGLHDARGATHSGFGSFDDEPSHLVTGLMFRDYIAAGLPGSPRAFAENYYVHYPKVGIGQWPPVFYAIQGFWMLAFGESANSLLWLMSVMTALLGVAVLASLRAHWGPVSAFLFGLLLCALPLVQRMGSVIMTEVPLALFCLFAALQFSRFLETQRARHTFGFAFFAILAILTKGNALSLALLPALAIPLSGRWRTLRRPALWASGALVAAICAPWYWFTLSISASTWAGGSTPTLGYAARASMYYATGLVGMAGAAVALCALLGILAHPPGRARCPWASLIALLIATLLFHVVIPSSIEERHLTLVAAPWILLAGIGLSWLARHPWLRNPGFARLAPALLLAAFSVSSFEMPTKDNHGYREAIAHIAAHPDLDDSRILIASDSLGEGLFIAAGALADERPTRVLLRGSKVLASSTWMGDDYQPAFTDMNAMTAYMADLPIGVVAFDLSTRKRQWFPHMDMLGELLETRPDIWQPLGIFDVFRDGQHFPEALRLYRQIGHEEREARPVDFQTLYNRTL